MRVCYIYFSVLCITISSSLLVGQNNISFDNFFFEDLRQQLEERSVLTPSYNPQLIDEIEIRTETDEFNLDRQRYSLRINPASRKEIHASKKLLEAQAAEYSRQSQESYIDIVDNTYENILRYYKLKEQSSLEAQLMTILMDQNRVYEKLLDSKKSISNRWIDTQKEIADLKITQRKNELLLKSLNPKNNNISFNDFIEIEKIKSLIISLTSDNRITSADQEYQIEKNILNQEIALEKAESEKIFDFFQLEYRGPSVDPWEEKFSLTAAVRIPMNSNNQRLKLAELEMEKSFLNLTKEEENRKRDLELTEINDELALLLELYDSHLANIIDIKNNSDQIISIYRQHGDPDPLFELRQKEMLIKKELSLLESKMNIIEKYIELCESSEVLYQLPPRNYLSSI